MIKQTQREQRRLLEPLNYLLVAALVYHGHDWDVVVLGCGDLVQNPFRLVGLICE